MAKEKNKSIFMKQSVSVGTTKLTEGKLYDRPESEADNLIAGGFAMEATEELRNLPEKRRALPENKPVDEADKVIAEHESGAEVAYKDPRVKGPLTDTENPQVEELPMGDIPTGTPVGVMKAAEKERPKTTVEPPNVEKALENIEGDSGGDDKKSSSKSSKKSK